jgi:hypothetical protein
MCFKGVAAVGDEKRQPPPGREHPDDLFHRLAVIGNVLEHLMAEHQVKGLGRER